MVISSQQQQKLRSNLSWMNLILNFPVDLLFGQIAYAADDLQSSDSDYPANSTLYKEGIWVILEKARNGDPHAQLEMLRRIPRGASFSDAVYSSYKAWNDPIMSFKHNVHNRLGASWFLPGSMGDIGIDLIPELEVVAQLIELG